MTRSQSYKVYYPRTADWWINDWHDLSSWCTAQFGWGNWNYINECFTFEKESNKLMFIMKWS